MSQPIRVLHILTEMKGGGVDAFLMNMYRHIDRSQIQFDFLLGSRENIYAQELAQLGSRVSYVSRYTRHPFQNRMETRAFLQENPYSIVHVHGNALMHISPLMEAKRAGVPVRIMHSHSTFMKFRLLLPLHQFNRLFLDRWCNCRLACSDAAGKWMFRSSYTVIHNAIELNRFRFDPEARTRIRQELGLEDDTLAIIQVGRFLAVKNHSFTLQVLKAVLEQRKNAMLVLVGSGPLMDQIRTEAQEAGLSDHVRFLGVRSDVGTLLSGMDAFVMPSRYEGLGIAAVEAQANGLYTLCSDAVPEEAIVLPHALRLTADDPVQWAEALLTSHRLPTADLSELEQAGYQIQTEAHRLQGLYLDLLGK